MLGLDVGAISWSPGPPTSRFVKNSRGRTTTAPPVADPTLDIWRGHRSYVPIRARLHTFSRPTVTTASVPACLPDRTRRPSHPFKRLPKLPFQLPPISTPKVVVAHLPSFLKCTTWLVDSVYPAPCKTNIELRVSRWIYCLVKENTFTGKIDQSSSLGLLSLTLPRTIYDIASFVLTSNMFQPPHVGAVKILWVQSFLSFQNLLALGRKIVLWVWWLNPRRIWAEAAARFFVHIYIYILYSLSLDK